MHKKGFTKSRHSIRCSVAPLASSRSAGVRDIRGAKQNGLAIPRTETLRGDERGDRFYFANATKPGSSF